MINIANIGANLAGQPYMFSSETLHMIASINNNGIQESRRKFSDENSNYNQQTDKTPLWIPSNKEEAFHVFAQTTHELAQPKSQNRQQIIPAKNLLKSFVRR